MVVSDSITFEEAIDFTESLLEEIETGKITDVKLEETLSSLVKTMNGSRGFFVTYLTADLSCVENPSQSLINALKTFPEIVSELMVKNLVMSTAMAITHNRNSDAEMAANSQKVSRNCANLINKLQLDLLQAKLQEMATSITTNSGEYQDFLAKWGYNDEQKQAMLEAVISCQK
jgi:hypothetical protein